MNKSVKVGFFSYYFENLPASRLSGFSFFLLRLVAFGLWVERFCLNPNSSDSPSRDRYSEVFHRIRSSDLYLSWSGRPCSARFLPRGVLFWFFSFRLDLILRFSSMVDGIYSWRVGGGVHLVDVRSETANARRRSGRAQVSVVWWVGHRSYPLFFFFHCRHAQRKDNIRVASR